MRLAQVALFSTLALALAWPAAAATHSRRSTSSRAFSKRAAAKPKIFGQRTIEDDRATQIQAALIKAGYLSGTPSGHWDAESIAAMTKLQADNGWQTKLVPDSRALIKIGLGPGTSPATSLTASGAATSANGDVDRGAMAASDSSALSQTPR